MASVVAFASSVRLPRLATSCCASSEQPPKQNAATSFTPGPRKDFALPPISFAPPQQESPSSAAARLLADPSSPHANVLWGKGYNLQIFVGETESADSVVRRFRRQVMDAGIIFECRRRRYFETPQDIVKRKQKEGHRRKANARFRSGPRPIGGFRSRDGDGEERKEGGSYDDNDDDFWGGADSS